MKTSKRIANGQFIEAAALNNFTYNHYLDMFLNLAISLYKWDGFPPTVNKQMLERYIWFYGEALIFKDDIIGLLGTPFVGGPPLDIYNEPIRRTVNLSNGYRAQRSSGDSVIIHNNLLKSSVWRTFQMYAYRLYEIDRTIDVNVKAQKRPIILKGSQKQLLTLKNMWKNYDGNEPLIVTDNDFDTSFEVIAPDTHYNISDLNLLRQRRLNEFMEFIGIPAGGYEKRERENTYESAVGVGSAMAQQYSYTAARELAAEEINAMFGLNVTVQIRNDVIKTVTEAINANYTLERENNE